MGKEVEALQAEVSAARERLDLLTSFYDAQRKLFETRIELSTKKLQLEVETHYQKKQDVRTAG